MSKPQQRHSFRRSAVFGLHTAAGDEDRYWHRLWFVALISVLESGSVLLLDKPQVLAKAKALGTLKQGLPSMIQTSGILLRKLA